MIRRLTVVTVVLAAWATPALAAPLKIKLGTVAPQDSRYVQLIEDMGQKWSDASGGQVKIVVYPGGVAGNEGDMIRKIGVGQLQAGAISTVGIHDISSEPQTLNVPMLVKTQDEVDYLLTKLRPRLDAALLKKGFVAVNWAYAGTPRLFSTYPIAKVADLAKCKIWAWAGDPATVESWRAAGFSPVVLSETDIMPSLETGLINALADPPLFAFVTRFFDKATYMLNLPWGTLVGATVIRKDTWEKIPADLRPKLLAIAEQTATELSADVRKLDVDAVEQMKKQGLHVIQAENLPAWQANSEKAWGTVRGKAVPADLFDEVKRLVAEYRAQTKN